MNAPGAEDLSLPTLRAFLCGVPDPLAREVARRYGGTEQEWVRQFVRFDPTAEIACRLHYRHRLHADRIVGLELPGPLRDIPYWDDRICRWQAFPHDAALPTLPTVWATLASARIVRYRPGHRCTFEARTAGERCFVKVFADGAGHAIHEASQHLWQASTAGRVDFATPRPLCWEAEQAALWQSAVPGRPIALSMLTADAGALAARLGDAAASLPRSGQHFTGYFGPDEQRVRTQRYADELSRRLPAEAAGLATLMATLRAVADAWRPCAPQAIHGALHLHQWLLDGTRPGLVDLDRLCMGDPELDVATFITELDYEDRTHVPVAKLQAAFVAAYGARIGALDSDRLAWYGVHKHLAKALKCVRGLRLDAERRACRALSRAFALATRWQ